MPLKNAAHVFRAASAAIQTGLANAQVGEIVQSTAKTSNTKRMNNMTKTKFVHAIIGTITISVEFDQANPKSAGVAEDTSRAKAAQIGGEVVVRVGKVPAPAPTMPAIPAQLWR